MINGAEFGASTSSAVKIGSHFNLHILHETKTDFPEASRARTVFFDKSIEHVDYGGRISGGKLSGKNVKVHNELPAERGMDIENVKAPALQYGIEPDTIVENEKTNSRK